MSPPSLHQLAQRACIKNIRSLTTVGEMPYDLVRSILLRVENPEQLRDIEENSPHICGRDAELWKEFIRRDIPNGLSKLHEPEDSTEWYDVYIELLAISQDEAEADARILEASMKDLADERSKHTVKFVNARTLPKLPGKSIRRQVVAAVSGNPSVLSFAAGSKTKTTTGRDVLNRVRREVREASLFSARKSALSVPTHQLAGKASQPRKAPVGLVQGHKKPSIQPSNSAIKIRVPGRSIDATKTTSPSLPVIAEKCGKHLNALIGGTATTTTTSTESEANTSVRAPLDNSAVTSLPKSSGIGNRKVEQMAPSKASISPERPVGGSKAPQLSQKPKLVMRRAPVDIFMPVKKRRMV